MISSTQTSTSTLSLRYRCVIPAYWSHFHTPFVCMQLAVFLKYLSTPELAHFIPDPPPTSQEGVLLTNVPEFCTSATLGGPCTTAYSQHIPDCVCCGHMVISVYVYCTWSLFRVVWTCLTSSLQSRRVKSSTIQDVCYHVGYSHCTSYLLPSPPPPFPTSLSTHTHTHVQCQLCSRCGAKIQEVALGTLVRQRTRSILQPTLESPTLKEVCPHVYSW